MGDNGTCRIIFRENLDTPLNTQSERKNFAKILKELSI
jgi:hypothetical protein